MEARTVTKIVHFEAAHRLFGYEGPCNNIHGHSYKAEITVVADIGTKDNFIIDFSVLKGIINDRVTDHFDHVLMLNSEDPLVGLLADTSQWTVVFDNRNPTAEVISESIFHRISPYIQDYFNKNDRSALKMMHIKLWETESSYATYSRNF